MSGTAVTIKTQEGNADCLTFQPKGNGPWPAIILYMDGFGIRPELKEMAQRMASQGYYLLLPNLYYRTGPFKPFNPQEVFSGGPDRDRLMKQLATINNGMIMQDTRYFLDFLDKQSDVKKGGIGCYGYCMGGPFALSAAGNYPEKMAAAASFHGASLATDSPDSPHLLAKKMKAKIYVAVAETDPWFTMEEKERLEKAFKEAKLDYKIEVYPGVIHGFAVTGLPVYNKEASERHWKELTQLFKTAL